MNKFLGVGVTALSVMTAAIVSGLRLKPYLDAGETYTPPTFALYPAFIAAAIAVPIILLLRKWRGKMDIDIGPITLTDRQPFMVLWCLLYVIIAVTFFPYRPPYPHRAPHPQTPQPAEMREAANYEAAKRRAFIVVTERHFDHSLCSALPENRTLYYDFYKA